MSKKKPYKAGEFVRYLEWKSIHSVLRGTRTETIEKIGLDDLGLTELSQIRTQAEFAQKYKVDCGTLSDWNKRIDEENLLIRSKNNVLQAVIDNVNMAFAIKQINNGTPAGIRVLNQLNSKDTEEHHRHALVNRREVTELIRKQLRDDGPVLVMQDDSPASRAGIATEIEKTVDRILNLAYPEPEDSPAERIAKLFPLKTQ